MALTLALCLLYPNISTAKSRHLQCLFPIPSLLKDVMIFIWSFASLTLSVLMRFIHLSSLQLFPSIGCKAARLIFLRSNSSHTSTQLSTFPDILAAPVIIFTHLASHSNTSVIWPLADLSMVCFHASKMLASTPVPQCACGPAVLDPKSESWLYFVLLPHILPGLNLKHHIKFFISASIVDQAHSVSQQVL